MFDQIKKNNPFDQLDTLRFTQIAQNLSTNVTYLISPTPERARILSASLSMMQSADQQGESPEKVAGPEWRAELQLQWYRCNEPDIVRADCGYSKRIFDQQTAHEWVSCLHSYAIRYVQYFIG